MEPFREQSYIAGTLFFFILALLGTLTLLNIFIAVVANVYGEKLEGANANWEREVNLLHGDLLAKTIWAERSSGRQHSSDEMETMKGLDRECPCPHWPLVNVHADTIECFLCDPGAGLSQHEFTLAFFLSIWVCTAVGLIGMIAGVEFDIFGKDPGMHVPPKPHAYGHHLLCMLCVQASL